MGIEKAKYSVIEQTGKSEIRRYKAQIIAETVVESGFDDADNIAFRRLFNYKPQERINRNDGPSQSESRFRKDTHDRSCKSAEI